MVGIENNINVLNTLKIIKEKYNINPAIITCDFSPNIIGPICEVFGEEKLQIDGFHVMQELNRGIRTDILNYKKKMFVSEIQDLKFFRKWLSKVQKNYQKTGTFDYDLETLTKNVDSTHVCSSNCLNVITSIFNLFKDELDPFFQMKLKEHLLNLKNQLDDNVYLFSNTILEALPKRELTDNGIFRIKILIIRKLKSLFVIFRLALEQEIKQFNKNYWIIFCQPETMTVKQNELLEQVLSKYKALKEYRNMTLSIGELYRKEISEITGSQIDNLVLKNYYSEKLKSAIKTIKKYKFSIIRFVTTFKNKPKVAKVCHSSMEHLHNKVKLPFKFGYNRCKLETVTNKLQIQLCFEVKISL